MSEALNNDGVIVTPRDAGTVMVLRNGPETGEVEVFMMHRQPTMAFAPNAVVFPGGGVEPSDYELGETLGLGPSWVGRLGVQTLHHAGAIVSAAIRELREEAGVVVAPQDLGLFGGWITPEMSPRRYRTWTFITSLPEGQEARELSTESTKVEWTTAAAALDRADAGEMRLMTPAYSCLLALSTYETIEDALRWAGSASVTMFTPLADAEGSHLPKWAKKLAATRSNPIWR